MSTQIKLAALAALSAGNAGSCIPAAVDRLPPVEVVRSPVPASEPEPPLVVRRSTWPQPYRTEPTDGQDARPDRE